MTPPATGRGRAARRRARQEAGRRRDPDGDPRRQPQRREERPLRRAHRQVRHGLELPGHHRRGDPRLRDHRGPPLARDGHAGDEQPAPDVGGRAGHPRHPAHRARLRRASRSATRRTSAAASSSPRSSPRRRSRSCSRSTWPTRRRAAGSRIDEERLSRGRSASTSSRRSRCSARGSRRSRRGSAPARPSPLRPRYDDAIEAALAEIDAAHADGRHRARGRWRVMALVGDESLRAAPRRRTSPTPTSRGSTRSGARSPRATPSRSASWSRASGSRRSTGSTTRW